MIKIIDNKKIELTDDEFKLYQQICRSYDRPNMKGEDLFRGLFESDDHGMIVFLRPPSTHYTSMEIYLFLSSIFQHQQMRVMRKQVDETCAELKEKVEKFLNK